MARVLRMVKGHLYAYEVATVEGRKVQRYIGPASEREVAAWLDRRSAGRKNAVLEARRGPQNERGYIDDPVADITDVQGRGYWRLDGQPPASFLADCVAIYERKTGRRPAVVYCHPDLVGDLGGDYNVKAAKVNARMLILAGG